MEMTASLSRLAWRSLLGHEDRAGPAPIQQGNEGSNEGALEGPLHQPQPSAVLCPPAGAAEGSATRSRAASTCSIGPLWWMLCSGISAQPSSREPLQSPQAAVIRPALIDFDAALQPDPWSRSQQRPKPLCGAWWGVKREQTGIHTQHRQQIRGGRLAPDAATAPWGR